MFTDPDFLKIFSFPLVKGSTETALQDLSNIIISENMAKAIFGKEDPMGKSLQVGLDANRKEYVVSTGTFVDRNQPNDLCLSRPRRRSGRRRHSKLPKHQSRPDEPGKIAEKRVRQTNNIPHPKAPDKP